jgi:ATP-dependent DNA helicase RecG
VRRVDEVVEAVNSSALIMKPGAHERRQIYPPVALQQIVRNALMHRNYEGTNSPVRVTWFDDRVEVLSPGGPYGAVTPSNFGQPGLTDYRNPVVAEAFRAYHFVEKFGMGLEIVRVSLERNGNPPLEIQAIDTFVNATIRAAP